MEGKYTDTRYVHSLGEVEAIVSYQQSKEIKFKQNDNKIYSLDEAVKAGTDEITSEFEDKIIDKNRILNKKVNVDKHEDGVVVSIVYEILENIGEEQKIE